MQCPKAVLFDLDETLAPSFQPIAQSMADRLSNLATRVPIAIMSGAGFDRIVADVVGRMTAAGTRLMIFPNSTSQCYLYRDNAWQPIYSHLLNEEERTHIKETLRRALAEHPDLIGTEAHGEQIIDRESQIAFTAVGVNAPPEVKASWDPTGERRQRIARDLLAELSGFDILIGGASTIDFTKKAMNKAHGVHWLAEYLNVNPESMLFVGDALYPGGNDEVVIPTGIQTHTVTGPADTERLIDELLLACPVV